jgi:hypothetical protein
MLVTRSNVVSVEQDAAFTQTGRTVMHNVSTMHKISAAAAVAVLVPMFWPGGPGAVGHAAVSS